MKFFPLSCCIFSVFCFSDSTLAQIMPDRTLGTESSIVTPNVTIKDNLADRIDGGAIRGSNLFHSFEQFNIGENQRVYFANPNGIKNIFSRITSNNPSNILGTLGVDGAANLFLLNPNGIIFGKNATLDLRSSFVASTANSIQFGNQGFFSATNPTNPPLLTVNPSAFLFNQQTSGRIENRSTVELSRRPERTFGLQVPESQSLLLIGGEILIDKGGLNARDGRIELAAVTGEATVGLNIDGNNLSLTLPDYITKNNIFLDNNARINVNGEGGGLIQIQAANLSLTNLSEISADTLGEGNGQGISIQTSQLNIRDGSQISATARENSQGNSGGITINAERIELLGTGNNQGGNSNNSRGGSSRNNNRPSKIASDAQGAGQAGDLIINTRQLILQDGAKISASTIDRPGGGSITVNASEFIELIGTSPTEERSSGISVQTRGIGKAGDLTINTRRLIVRDGAELSASTYGDGAGGNININALEEVIAIGISENGQQFSRIIADTGNSLDTNDAGIRIGTGDGGNLTITTRRLIVQDGAKVSVSSLSNEANPGDAGNLLIKAANIDLESGAITANTTSGNGGNIRLEVANLLLLRRNGQISTSAGTNRQGGDGGNVNINADLIVAMPGENSDITANAFSGRGGQVSIITQGLFGLQLRSLEDLQATLGTTDLSQFDSSELASNDISAISQTSPQLSGEILVVLQGIDPAQGLVELPTEVVDVTGLIDQNFCIASEGSEFTITGRGGLPTPPSEALNARATWEDWRIGEENNSGNSRVETSSNPRETRSNLPEINEAQGWYKNANGHIVLVAEVREVTPNGNWLTNPNCRQFTRNSSFNL
ncbi:filamentous hemagglutinin N-terminal domain-containing protein [Aerosakkonemataceae cyanobacterium BLCC-F154]|uniref:Filamentous hemagglutinin N-terminal domain-containing protein n=1 Tax=Floridaenema fluviatile BLCC-F154 TaxID=3153640 RepID=A0ABV4YGD7_9CYAN